MSIPPDSNAAPVSVGDILRGVLHRKLLIVCFTVAAFLGGLATVHLFDPVYSAEAQLLIDNLETRFDRMQIIENQTTPNVDDRIVASQMAVLRSEDMGRRVIVALSLHDDPEFNARLRGIGTFKKIKIALGFGDDPRIMTPEQIALASYLDGLSVYQQPDSNVISVKYSAAKAETAANIANTLAETYIVATRESQSQPTERARAWLSKQIDALRAKLAASEQAVEQFRAEAGLLKGETATLGTQEISELNTQITVAQAASTEAKAKADAIRQLLADQGSVDSASEVLASPVIQRLKEQRTEAARAVAELSATYLPNHPKMIAAQNQRANIDRQFRGEALKIVSALEEQANVAEVRETSLRDELETLKGKASSANLDDVKLKALEREAGADRALLEAMLSRYAEASARQDQTAQPGMARIIQSATVPASPSFPKRGPMALLITLAGLALGLGLAFLTEIMTATARLTERLDHATNLAKPEPVPQPIAVADVRPAISSALTSVPGATANGDGLESAELARAGKVMAGWVKSAQRDENAKCFAITSIGGSIGDSSLATLAVARELAREGSRVVVADLSRAASWLEKLCGIATGPGITDLLQGEAAFTKVIGRDTKSSIHLLRFGTDRSGPAMARVAERIGDVLAALGSSYEVVVVHGGEATLETPALLRKCDGALVLAPASRLAEAQTAVRKLSDSGVKAVSHVLIGPPRTGKAPEFSLAAGHA